MAKKLPSISNWNGEIISHIKATPNYINEIQRGKDMLKRSFYGYTDRKGRYRKGSLERTIEELRKNPEAPIPPFYAGLVNEELFKENRERGLEEFEKAARRKLKVLDTPTPTKSSERNSLVNQAVRVNYLLNLSSRSWASFERVMDNFKKQVAKAIKKSPDEFLKTDEDYRDFFKLWQLYPKSEHSKALNWEYRYMTFRDMSYAIENRNNEDSVFFGKSIREIYTILDKKRAEGEWFVNGPLEEQDEEPEEPDWWSGGGNEDI